MGLSDVSKISDRMELTIFIISSANNYSMLKIKSNSVVLEEPAGTELKEHIAKLIERQEEQMREKLQRQMEKEARVQAIEKDFLEWADKKQGKTRQKIEKSTKNKEEHLNKIVKKCKDHDKYLTEKFKNYESKRKADVRAAWKKAEEFNHSIENYQTSKLASQLRPTHPQRTEENLAHSRLCAQRPVTHDRANHRQYFSATDNNPSKLYGNNSSKDYWGELNRSIRQLKLTETIPKHEDQMEELSKIQVNNKLKETLNRFKQQIEQTENQKIQQLGERLERIERSRMKKVALQKERKNYRGDNLDTEPPERRPNKTYKIDRGQRIQSESIMRENRARDWSQSNKQKREELSEAYRQNGTEYLQQQKLKYMKTTLAKKIAVSAIEKKLYFQRLNH